MQKLKEIVAHIVLKELEVIVLAHERESNPYEIFVKEAGAKHFKKVNEYSTMESVIIWIGGLYEGVMMDMHDNVLQFKFEGVCD